MGTLVGRSSKTRFTGCLKYCQRRSELSIKIYKWIFTSCSWLALVSAAQSTAESACCFLALLGTASQPHWRPSKVSDRALRDPFSALSCAPCVSWACSPSALAYRPWPRWTYHTGVSACCCPAWCRTYRIHGIFLWRHGKETFCFGSKHRTQPYHTTYRKSHDYRHRTLQPWRRATRKQSTGQFWCAAKCCGSKLLAGRIFHPIRLSHFILPSPGQLWRLARS